MNNHKPYYAVIFTSIRTENIDGYHAMAAQMEILAKQQPGFLGVESASETIGITVSYWKSLDAITKWKAHTDHVLAQQKGRADWYKWYKTRICLVEREYDFNK